MNKITWRPGLDRELANANGGIDPSAQGYEYAIQTTTMIRAEVVKQEFYEVPFGDYVPVIIGTGAWMEDIKTNLTYDSAGPFEEGITDLSSQAAVPQVDTGIHPVSAKIYTWNKGYQYSTPEVRKALASDNWDVIRSKHEALVRNWQLGIQQVAFLGLALDQTSCPGLLSNTGVTVNTAVITQAISTMDANAFATLVATIIGSYFSNSNSTKLPDHLAMPMQDFLGLADPVSPQFPNVSKLEYLEKAFQRITKNAGFTIYGVAYADQANNAGVWTALGTNRYCLYRKNAETMKMDLPVDFILNAPGTADNYRWQGVGVAQFTGLIIYRQPEVMYFDWAA